MSKSRSKTPVFHNHKEIQIQPIIYKEIQPVITTETQPIIQREIQPVVHKEIQPVIQQNIQPVITYNIQPIIHKKIQPVIFLENQTNIEEEIQRLEQSQPHIKELQITKKDVQPIIQREIKTIHQPVVQAFIQKEMKKKETTIEDEKTETLEQNLEIVEYVPYIQYKNGDILPYEKKDTNITNFKSNEKYINPNNTDTTIMETIIAVNFVSLNQNITYPMACRKTDIFAKIEEKLYREFPSLKSKKIYFLANGNKINKSLTIEQNKIKNGNTILINEIE